MATVSSTSPVCVCNVGEHSPVLGCCFRQGSGPSAKNADKSARLWWEQIAGTVGESALTVQWTVVACHLSEPQICTRVPPFIWWEKKKRKKKHAVLITVPRFSQLLPLPRQTSAKWQPLSPGSLQNSTTSRHVVSGVMGTSVTACSPSLRYTVNIIWEIRIQSWGLKE